MIIKFKKIAKQNFDLIEIDYNKKQNISNFQTQFKQKNKISENSLNNIKSCRDFF